MKRILLMILLAGRVDADELVPKTVDEDPTLPAIEIADTKLHAQAFGDPDAPILMILHGGPGSDYRDMMPLAALADDGYRVVFWDQRGAGLSRRHEQASYSFAEYLEDLRLVIEHYTTHSGQPIVFIGHSWGAMYSTWFIDTYGDYGGRIRGSVLSDPGAFTKAQLDAFSSRQNASIDFFAEQLGDMAWQDQFLRPSDQARADYMDTLGSMVGTPSEHRDPNNLAPLWRSGSVVRNAMFALAKRDGFDWTRHLSAFQTPVVFIRGDLNTACPLDQQQELASAYPHASIVTMIGVGHKMQWERPAEYLADVRAYLSTLDLSEAP